MYDDKIKLQTQGGPIGLQLTGILAQLFMIWWDKQIQTTMKQLGLELRMYKSYVDDINMVMKATKPGLRFDGTKLVSSETTIEEDQELETDERDMRLFRSTGNSIHHSIEMEVDCPSRHKDRKMPILDLKVWIEKGEQRGQYRQQVVLHEFYYKEVASKSMINARSALPWKCKRTIMTQEVLRVLLNCNTRLPWEVVVVHVNHMMQRMQYSGYNQRFRSEVVKSALKAYENIKARDITNV